MIKEITLESNGVPTLNIYEDTDVEQLLQDYSDDDEFTLSQINIVTDDDTIEVKTYGKWLDYDDLEELLTKLYELYEKDVSELYYELPDGDRENFSVSEWMPHDEEFYNIYFEGNPIEAVRAVLFGDVRWSDDYVRFNGYGNLETTQSIPYDDEADNIITSWVNELI